MTRQEQQYYNNIERIATALEKMVAQGEKADNAKRYDRINAASRLMYGNDKGRSQENYDYPNRVTINNVTDSRGVDIRVPNINSDLDQRIHDEAQSKTGGEFPAWYKSLTSEEQDAYTRVYNF